MVGATIFTIVATTTSLALAAILSGICLLIACRSSIGKTTGCVLASFGFLAIMACAVTAYFCRNLDPLSAYLEDDKLRNAEIEVWTHPRDGDAYMHRAMLLSELAFDRHSSMDVTLASDYYSSRALLDFKEAAQLKPALNAAANKIEQELKSKMSTQLRN